MRVVIVCEDCGETGEATLGTYVARRGVAAGFTSFDLPPGWGAAGDGGVDYGQSGSLSFACPKCIERYTEEEAEADARGAPIPWGEKAKA